MKLYFTIFLLFFFFLLHAQKSKLIRFEQKSTNGTIYGYLNNQGDTIIPAGKYICTKKTIKKPVILQYSEEPEKWIMLDNNGTEIHQIYTIGENPDIPNNGLQRIVKNGKIGFINKKGKIIIPAKYNRVEPFCGKKCVANIDANKIDNSSTDAQNNIIWEGGKWGIINKKGKIIKPFIYTRIWNDTLGYYEYQKQGERFIFTEKGKIKNIF